MSASTMVARVRLGDAAIAQLRQAEAAMRAERRSLAENGVAARCAELARMQVADSDSFGRITARCDALQRVLSSEEIAKERTAIVEDARRGARSDATARIERLERRADRVHATRVSQRLVTDEILGRAGRFVPSGADQDKIDGHLDMGDKQAMPLSIRTKEPAGEGGPTEHELVFHNEASTNLGECPEQEDAVREIVGAAGPEVELDERYREPTRPRRKNKRAKAAQKKARGAG